MTEKSEVKKSMFKLSYLLKGLEYECIRGNQDAEVSGVVYDSRKVAPGSLFICIKGANVDGHDFIPDVVRAGARVVVVEKDVEPFILKKRTDGTKVVVMVKDNKPFMLDDSDLEPHTVRIPDDMERFENFMPDESSLEPHTTKVTDVSDSASPADVTIIKVKDTRYAMAFISAAYFGNPANELKVIGITGTKGKTTTTYLVKSILEQAGRKVGLIGTIEVIIGDTHIHANNTTPESYLIQQYFRRMADAGCDTVVMEVSSQGLMLHRTQGFIFDYGIFTNIEPDHIGPNEHKDFDDYLNCKGLLFKQCRVGIVNKDDAHWESVVKGHTCVLETYAIEADADLRAEHMELISGGGKLGAAFDVKGLMDFHAEIAAPGKFSVYNALTAIAICRHFGVEQEAVLDALLKAKVKGRIELVKVSDDFTLMIDYAHNAMALQSLLSTLKEYNPHRLVCVFGCGGNRSKLRRYDMGEVSGKLADLTIITSDNPRFEEPQAIIDDIKTGIARTDGKYVEICDRKEAIAYAIKNGEPGDIIVLAGKGHEDYQEIKGVKYPMDERDLISDILAGMQ